MPPLGLRDIIGPQRQMELALAQIVGLGVIAEPGQLQAEIRLSVAQIDKEEAPVLRRLSLSHGSEVQSVLIKLKRLFQIRYVEVKMIECQQISSPLAFSISKFSPIGKQPFGKSSRADRYKFYINLFIFCLTNRVSHAKLKIVRNG